MTVHEILYQCFLYGVPLAVAASIYGMRWKEGLWGNTLGVFAVLFSAMVALGWWESLAILFCKHVPKALYIADFASFWAIFLLSLATICEVTRVLSRVRVKYDDVVEKVGNGIMSTILVLLLLGIYQFTMEMSPVGEHADATPPAQDSIQTKAFRLLTIGNLSSFTEVRPFDKNGEFRQDHFQRRQALMHQRLTDEKSSMQFQGTVPQRKH